MTTYREFFEGVLGHLGIKPTTGNLRAFGVVTIIEGRNHFWNPLNVTLPPSYPAFNSTGVRMFPDASTGALETAMFLANNPRWEPFVASLRGAKTRFGPLAALAKIYAQWHSYPRFLAVSTTTAAAVLREAMPS